MHLGPDSIQGFFAIVAGVLTIFKAESWVGPGLANKTVVRGPSAVVIGVIAIAIGAWLLFVQR